MKFVLLKSTWQLCQVIPGLPEVNLWRFLEHDCGDWRFLEHVFGGWVPFLSPVHLPLWHWSYLPGWLQETSRRIAKVSVEAKLQGFVEEDYIESFKPHLMDVVHSWCKGSTFAHICQMTDVFEGFILNSVLCFYIDEMVLFMPSALWRCWYHRYKIVQRHSFSVFAS